MIILMLRSWLIVIVIHGCSWMFMVPSSSPPREDVTGTTAPSPPAMATVPAPAGRAGDDQLFIPEPPAAGDVV